MSDDNEHSEIRAIDALRSYANYLDSKAIPLMRTLIADLEGYGAFGNAAKLARSIKGVLDRHPRHEHELLSIVGEYESPKKMRVVSNEEKNVRFIAELDDPNREAFLEDYRKNPPQSDPNIIEADQVEIVSDSEYARSLQVKD